MFENSKPRDELTREERISDLEEKRDRAAMLGASSLEEMLQCRIDELNKIDDHSYTQYIKVRKMFSRASVRVAPVGLYDLGDD